MRRVLGLALIVVACGGAERDAGDGNDTVAIAPDWVRVEAACGEGYSFYAPPEIAVQPAQGIDSCIDLWTTSVCSYHGDYGWFSNDLTGYGDLPQYRQMEKVIDGRRARVISALLEGDFIAAVHFGGIDPDSDKVALTLWVRCTDEVGRQHALTAFDTIVFPPQG